MLQKKLRAVFMRGGTSKALMFHQRDLPAQRVKWDPLFLAAMGSPDPYGRQLNGMGGGISSAIARPRVSSLLANDPPAPHRHSPAGAGIPGVTCGPVQRARRDSNPQPSDP